MKYPMPPPFDPDLDVLCYIEDPYHGPAGPWTWRCLFRCLHKQGEQW